ncbi:UNVERIFIED_CONTAM: hypothetical protein K2H54_016558, partial [Gekko kuhli]
KRLYSKADLQKQASNWQPDAVPPTPLPLLASFPVDILPSRGHAQTREGGGSKNTATTLVEQPHCKYNRAQKDNTQGISGGPGPGDIREFYTELWCVPLHWAKLPFGLRGQGKGSHRAVSPHSRTKSRDENREGVPACRKVSMPGGGGERF